MRTPTSKIFLFILACSLGQVFALSAFAQSTTPLVKFQVPIDYDTADADLTSSQGAQQLKDHPTLQTLVNRMTTVDEDSLATLASEARKLQNYESETMGVTNPKIHYALEFEPSSSRECGYQVSLTAEMDDGSSEIKYLGQNLFITQPSKQATARVAKQQAEQNKAQEWIYEPKLNECDPSKVSQPQFVADVQSLTKQIEAQGNKKLAGEAAVNSTENNVRAAENSGNSR